MATLNLWTQHRPDDQKEFPNAPVTFNGDHVNGHENGHSVNGKEESKNDVSVAEEATESSVNGAGLLKKTISKIWKLPQDIASGVSYQEINGTTTPSKATTNGSSNSEN